MKCLNCNGELKPILKNGKSYAQCDKCGRLFTAHDLKNRPTQQNLQTHHPKQATHVGEVSNQDQKETKNLKPYVVLQVVLKEKLIGTGSGNLSQLEDVINRQAAKGYRLHTISTASSGSTGWLGGDRIQATMIFERCE